ncbi:hypothetical protein [Mesorhizobium sp. IMUNJ 23232]|uniref:hypothetical protein n=1 Tax=Mesorhizobium sp. IMUNJ 23232 TaxID=3376064 RepID=UPI0037A8C073
MSNSHSLPNGNHPNEHPHIALVVLGQPDDVLHDARLTPQEKREVLASWASDIHAVPHVPSLRQLPDGSIIKVEDILRALRALDEGAKVVSADGSRMPPWQRTFTRRRTWDLRKWARYGRRPGDDDDPPPCPASAAIRPKSGGGAAFAVPEPVSA